MFGILADTLQVFGAEAIRFQLHLAAITADQGAAGVIGKAGEIAKAAANSN